MVSLAELCELPCTPLLSSNEVINVNVKSYTITQSGELKL